MSDDLLKELLKAKKLIDSAFHGEITVVYPDGTIQIIPPSDDWEENDLSTL